VSWVIRGQGSARIKSLNNEQPSIWAVWHISDEVWGKLYRLFTVHGCRSQLSVQVQRVGSSSVHSFLPCTAILESQSKQ
jgi:hypothetical protein